MRALRFAVLPLLVAVSLAAQVPPGPAADPAPATAVAPRRSAFFDVAALVNDEQRFGIEPLVFGRWSIGLVGAHRGTHETQALVPPVGVQPLIVPCPEPGCSAPYGSSTGYDDWSFDLAVRYYPTFLSMDGPGHRLMVYVGEFIGYHQRTITTSAYAVPLGEQPAAGASSSNPVAPTPISDRQRFSGWEPGAELGVRVLPLGPLFVDVGGTFRLVTIDDPTQPLRPGQVDARLVASVGLGW